MILDMSAVQPIKLDLGAQFKFRCYPGIKCFTKCCSRINILLTPYDIIRMKNRLGISSEEFLDKYTYLHIDEKSSFPYAMLRMRKDEENLCPFVTPEGCTIYTDRPASCRYYPIGQGILIKEGEKRPVNEEFYFIVRERHCDGFEEEKEWTIESWRADQEVDLYDEMNREWKEVQLMRNIYGKRELDPKKQAQLYMAGYDIDKFKRFVFESKFLDIFDIPKEERERIETDELALMKLAVKYIKYILMVEETLQLKKEIKEAKMKEEKK